MQSGAFHDSRELCSHLPNWHFVFSRPVLNINYWESLPSLHKQLYKLAQNVCCPPPPIFMDWFMPHADDIYLGIVEWIQKVTLSLTSYFEPVTPSSADDQWKALSTSKDSVHLALSWQVRWNLSPKLFFVIKGGLVQGSSIDVTKRKTNLKGHTTLFCRCQRWMKWISESLPISYHTQHN